MMDNSPEEELAELLGDKLRKTLDLTRLGSRVQSGGSYFSDYAFLVFRLCVEYFGTQTC